jgi:serine/threonine protein kinase
MGFSNHIFRKIADLSKMAAAKEKNLRLELPSNAISNRRSFTFPDFVECGDPFDSCCQVDHKDSGAHGSVYQVVFRDGTVKAVKVVDAGPRQTAEILRVLEEAEIGRQMKHPHLLPIEQVWYDGTRFILVMDLVEPLTKENVPESLKDRIALFQQLVSAVAHLYSQGILHRDIKIANTGLKLGEDGKPDLVLFDFGEGCKISEYYSECAGTVLNMSPEVVDHSQFSDRSEVWALMCYLVELLTGRSMILGLFDGPLGYIKKIHVQLKIYSLKEPPIPEFFKTDKSPAGIRLLEILRRGLAIDPAERLTFPELESRLKELIALL